ncbi:MAG: hypothetical protein IPK79_13625 [Vampirovibrionales bacterium]|nr:hypothetical protein [Vampirovibrionales bacterium]
MILTENQPRAEPDIHGAGPMVLGIDGPQDQQRHLHRLVSATRNLGGYWSSYRGQEPFPISVLQRAGGNRLYRGGEYGNAYSMPFGRGGATPAQTCADLLAR